jgi:FkbM family methyltransferase
MILLQIGAGAGDKDARADFKDGFSTYVKGLSLDISDRIVLVEPNPINIPYLRESWKDYKQAEIHTFGICPKSAQQKYITFYYAEEDGPHYQVFSMNKYHVQKHYPTSALKEAMVQCLTLEDFINYYIGSENIEMLALDIEGIDAEIILEIDFCKINCKYLSFEKLHLLDNKKYVFEKLALEGFKFLGNGLDHNGYDYLFQKTSQSYLLRPFLKQLNFLKMMVYEKLH